MCNYQTETILMKKSNLNNNLNSLLDHLDSIKDTLPMMLLLIRPYQKKADEEFNEFIKKNVEEIEEEDGKKSIAVKYEDTKIFERLSKNAQTSNLASKIIPESLFVSLLSQYDAFTNRLLKILFEIRPEYINNSERELTFSKLVEFESIEKAREYIIEKEVESVLRKSHSEQFEYLENKLGITLRKNLPVWSTFIEITQRRNLFVHCDGYVTNQYLKVCQDNKCQIDNVKINDRLKADVKYFIKAYECLYELSTKLTHTIWRKLLIDEIKIADQEINHICFDLLNSFQFELADVLLDFACKQDKHYNDASKNIFIVNRALSLYLQDKNDEAIKLIESKDWSASSDDFKLAHFVISEKNDEAFKLMLKIGSNGEVDKENYKNWPLFFKLRKNKEFQDTFKLIFNEEYNVLEIPKKPIQELINEVIKKNPELKKKTVKKVLSKKQTIEQKEIKQHTTAVKLQPKVKTPKKENNETK